MAKIEILLSKIVQNENLYNFNNLKIIKIPTYFQQPYHSKIAILTILKGLYLEKTLSLNSEWDWNGTENRLNESEMTLSKSDWVWLSLTESD